MNDKTMTEAVQSFAIKKALAYLNSHDPDEAIPKLLDLSLIHI